MAIVKPLLALKKAVASIKTSEEDFFDKKRAGKARIFKEKLCFGGLEITIDF